MEVEKYHWWHMVFIGDGGNVHSRSCGSDTTGLTSGKIADAIELYFPDKNVLMSNAIYLGYMTEEENNAQENKQAAKDWQEQEDKKLQDSISSEEQEQLLWYAAEKRKTGYPSVETLEQIGQHESARLLRQAYDLMSQAYYAFSR